ncbi:hypothetical protein OK349_14850 [Sphingomonas sp. BT-65]|uniref:hypothetical protein n=1 Tax=Sphingomonas sp. BT-65 TaxID=2989821 RepID=UPI0022367DDF|nr:hypothetical protein [Sphingomonas sp. BT-65]MCW4462991.1 hypothetical protein [Sphingomonas sp. BT-65]
MGELLALILALAAGGQQTPPAASAQTPTPTPSTTEQGGGIDWATLPDLPYRQPPQMTAAMHTYVQGQVRARRCRERRLVDGRPAMRVEVAVLVHPEDGVRASIPRSIGCNVVEQYAAGLVTSFARNNLTARGSGAEQWYRATVTFVWKK